MHQGTRDRTRVVIDNGKRQLLDHSPDEDSLGDLFHRLTADASLLVRQEISLARAELRESGTKMKESAKLMAVALLLAIPGALALTAFLVIALGQAFDSYWASSLMVGAILTGTAAIYARRAMDRAKTGTDAVHRTAESLGSDARWGKEELRTFKRELTA